MIPDWLLYVAIPIAIAIAIHFGKATDAQKAARAAREAAAPSPPLPSPVPSEAKPADAWSWSKEIPWAFGAGLDVWTSRAIDQVIKVLVHRERPGDVTFFRGACLVLSAAGGWLLGLYLLVRLVKWIWER